MREKCLERGGGESSRKERERGREEQTCGVKCLERGVINRRKRDRERGGSRHAGENAEAKAYDGAEAELLQ